MASLISILSLFLLVLANGYLTLPLINEQFQTSTMLSSNVDVTSQSPLLPRGLSMNQVDQTSTSLMGLQMTTLSDNLPESTSRDTRVLNEMTTLSPSMLTTVESTNEYYTTMESQSGPNSNKREASLDLPTNTSPVTTSSSSSSSAVTTELNLLQSSTNSLENSELTTEQSSSSKPSKKFTGLLKDKKVQEEDLEQENKDKDTEDKKPMKPSKTYKKENEDEKVQSDDEVKKPVKPSKTQIKVKIDDEVQTDDEDKVKPNKSNKNEKEDDKEKSDEDSKNTAAPVAQLYSEGVKNLSNYRQEYMDLDENNTFAVTQSGSTDSTSTLKYKKGKKPLNQVEESSPAKEEESN